MLRYLIRFVLPAGIMLALAFFAGSHSNPVLGMGGFVVFFTVAVTLLVEGKRRCLAKKERE